MPAIAVCEYRKKAPWASAPAVRGLCDGGRDIRLRDGGPVAPFEVGRGGWLGALC